MHNLAFIGFGYADVSTRSVRTRTTSDIPFAQSFSTFSSFFLPASLSQVLPGIRRYPDDPKYFFSG